MENILSLLNVGLCIIGFVLIYFSISFYLRCGYFMGRWDRSDDRKNLVRERNALWNEVHGDGIELTKKDVDYLKDFYQLVCKKCGSNATCPNDVMAIDHCADCGGTFKIVDRFVRHKEV